MSSASTRNFEKLFVDYGTDMATFIVQHQDSEYDGNCAMEESFVLNPVSSSVIRTTANTGGLHPGMKYCSQKERDEQK